LNGPDFRTLDLQHVAIVVEGIAPERLSISSSNDATPTVQAGTPWTYWHTVS